VQPSRGREEKHRQLHWKFIVCVSTMAWNKGDYMALELNDEVSHVKGSSAQKGYWKKYWMDQPAEDSRQYVRYTIAANQRRWELMSGSNICIRPSSFQHVSHATGILSKNPAGYQSKQTPWWLGWCDMITLSDWQGHQVHFSLKNIPCNFYIFYIPVKIKVMAQNVSDFILCVCVCFNWK
jgi:hypothetical protein